MSLQDHWLRFKRLVAKRRLSFALGLAIFAALVLTAVSLTIYKVGGYYRYDLSRPGYEKERSEIATTPSNVTYDTNSPLTKAAIDAFVQQLDTHRTNLEQYNTYDDSGLSDEDLEINPQSTTTQQ